MTGSVLDVLGSVSAVGDDFDLQGGATCGKGHKEFVPVSSGGPHLRMKAMARLMSATNTNRETSLAETTEIALAQALNALPGTNEWQIEARRTEETQLYAIGDRIESQRVVIDEQARVTLHNDHAPRAGDESAGETSTARGSAAH